MNTDRNLERSLPSPPEGKKGWPWEEDGDSISNEALNTTSLPKISVVTPSYNQGQFLEQAIRSVLLQNYPNLELIIIDGGSTDNSIEIIKKYDPWIDYWVSEEDRGQGHAINKGIKKATGEIIFWLNSDDILLPNAFFYAAKYFINNKNTKMVIGQSYIINEKSEIIGELKSYFSDWEELATEPQNKIRQVSTFFSRSLFNEYGLIDECLNISMDSDILIRFTKFEIPLIVNNYFSAYRQHPSAKSSLLLLQGYEETDSKRMKYLDSKKLRLKYRKNSAENWLKIINKDNLTLHEKIRCLMNSIKIKPNVIFTRKFWTTILYNIFNINNHCI
jgi:glycosyltransferase involved in cell wall biosynthesis